MIRKEIYSKILKDLSVRLGLQGVVTSEILGDFNQCLTHFRLSDAIDILEDAFVNCDYFTVFDAIKDISGRDPDCLDEDIPTIGTCYIFDVTEDIQKLHLQRFVYKTPDLVVLPTKTLFEENGRSVNFLAKQNVFIAIEEIYNNANVDQINQLWDCVQNLTENKLFIVCQEVAADNELLWRKYAYSYLCHIENGKIEIPSALRHTVSTFYSPCIIFWHSDTCYEQFFDIYNVLNEAKHSNDYLTIYLKIYQTLEYFAYRLKLVDITKGTASTRQSFTRRLMAVTDGFKKSEDKEFARGFKILFTTVPANIDADLVKPDVKAFIEKYYKVSYQGTNDIDSYAKIVYQIRNSIVHNKEAELHFTYGNIDEYKEIIPLISELIKTLGSGIVHIINEQADQSLVFDTKTLNLY